MGYFASCGLSSCESSLWLVLNFISCCLLHNPEGGKLWSAGTLACLVKLPVQLIITIYVLYLVVFSFFFSEFLSLMVNSLLLPPSHSEQRINFGIYIFFFFIGLLKQGFQILSDSLDLGTCFHLLYFHFSYPLLE